MTRLTVALPSRTSRFYEPVVRTLGEVIGMSPTVGFDGRELTDSSIEGYQLVFCRGTDVPKLVAEGLIDLGLTGYDMAVEAALATGRGLDIRSLAGARNSYVTFASAPGRHRLERLYTEYPNITRAWALSTLRYGALEIVHVHGSLEGLVSADPASAAVVLVTSGKTLAANGLVSLAPILATDLCVVRRSAGSPSSLGELDMGNLPRLSLPEFCLPVSG